MVSKMTVAKIPPAMTTVPADIRNPLHQQPAERRRRSGTKEEKMGTRSKVGEEESKSKNETKEENKRKRKHGRD